MIYDFDENSWSWQLTYARCINEKVGNKEMDYLSWKFKAMFVIVVVRRCLKSPSSKSLSSLSFGVMNVRIGNKEMDVLWVASSLTITTENSERQLGMTKSYPVSVFFVWAAADDLWFHTKHFFVSGVCLPNLNQPSLASLQPTLPSNSALKRPFQLSNLSR